MRRRRRAPDAFGHQEEPVVVLERRVRRLAVGVGVVMALLVVLQLVSGGLNIYLLDQNGNRADEAKITAHRASVAARKAKQAAKEIQTQRVTNTLANCKDQNARHDHTIDALDKLIAMATKGIPPAQAAEMKRGRASTILLIDALAPKQDCERRVRMLTAPQSSRAPRPRSP